MRLLLTLLVFASLGLSACSEADEPKTAAIEDLQLFRRPNGDRVVRGQLYNPGPTDLRGAQVQVTFYGDDNQPVGGMRIDLTSVEVGQRQSFEQVLDADYAVQSASVRQVLVY